MPHITVEYTNNIEEKDSIRDLLKKIHTSLINEGGGGIYLPHAIRSRAIELSDFVHADGEEDDAFVHVTLKIAPGRSEEVKEATGKHILEVLDNHFTETPKVRHTSHSIELFELKKEGDYYFQNSIDGPRK